MTEAADSIERLDESLGEHGESVIIRRGATDVAKLAKCKTLRAEQVISRGTSAQIISQAIMSPVGLEGLLPLRTTDKIVYGGIERAILHAQSIKYLGVVVRVNVEFAG